METKQNLTRTVRFILLRTAQKEILFIVSRMKNGTNLKAI